MVQIGESWGVTLVIGGGLLLLFGLTFLFITRTISTGSAFVRCPITGHATVVQHIAEEGSFLTDVVSCAAFPGGRPITCGMPCLTGGVATRVSTPAEDSVTV